MKETPWEWLIGSDGNAMRLIMKLFVWGFIALMILPSVSPVPEHESATAKHITNGSTKKAIASADILQIAIGFAGDFKNICARDQQLCDAGGRLIESAFSRAKDGVVVVANMVEMHRTQQQVQNDPTTTSSIK